jgi:hypothetical protein
MPVAMLAYDNTADDSTGSRNDSATMSANVGLDAKVKRTTRTYDPDHPRMTIHEGGTSAQLPVVDRHEPHFSHLQRNSNVNISLLSYLLHLLLLLVTLTLTCSLRL